MASPGSRRAAFYREAAALRDQQADTITTDAWVRLQRLMSQDTANPGRTQSVPN
jgi:hypothetical protein